MPFKVWSPRSITLVTREPGRSAESRAEDTLTQSRIPAWIASPLQFEAHCTSWLARFGILCGITTHCYLLFIRIPLAWSEDKGHHLQSIHYPSGTPCRDGCILSLDPPSTQWRADGITLSHGWCRQGSLKLSNLEKSASLQEVWIASGLLLSLCPSGWVLY